jgi:hypothetical protein
MADVFGENYNKARIGPGAERAPSSEYRGFRRGFQDTYEAFGLGAGNDIIVGTINNAMKVLASSVIYHDAMGTGVTLSLILRATDGNEVVVFPAETASTAGSVGYSNAVIDDLPAQCKDHDDAPSDGVILVRIAGGLASGTIKTQIDVQE